MAGAESPFGAELDRAVEGVRASLEAKTGRDLDAWLALLARDGPADRRGRLDWLKEHHGLGHFQARLIVEEAAVTAAPTVAAPSAGAHRSG